MSNVKKPAVYKWWTTLYFGARGSGKSQEQAKQIVKILKYLKWLYKNKPALADKQAIIFSVQKLSEKYEKEYAGYIYYWTTARDLRFCPRIICWRGSTKHRLHGAWVIFDDIAAMLPNTHGFQMPEWLIKFFSQARKFGIHILANCQDPFSANINFRRYTDMAFKCRKLFATRDPDETLSPLKFIFGVYQIRRIPANMLWEYGDMTESEIALLKMKEKDRAKAMQRPNLFKGMWRGSLHLITKNSTAIYDTLQEIQEYIPVGYEHGEKHCIDPRHNHTNKKAANYCGFSKVTHDLV